MVSADAPNRQRSCTSYSDLRLLWLSTPVLGYRCFFWNFPTELCWTCHAESQANIPQGENSFRHWFVCLCTYVMPAWGILSPILPVGCLKFGIATFRNFKLSIDVFSSCQCFITIILAGKGSKWRDLRTLEGNLSLRLKLLETASSDEADGLTWKPFLFFAISIPRLPAIILSEKRDSASSFVR